MVFKEEGRNKGKASLYIKKPSICAIESIQVCIIKLSSIVYSHILPFRYHQYDTFIHRFSHHLPPVADLIQYPFTHMWLSNFRTISAAISLSYLWGFSCNCLLPTS